MFNKIIHKFNSFFNIMYISNKLFFEFDIYLLKMNSLFTILKDM